MLTDRDVQYYVPDPKIPWDTHPGREGIASGSPWNCPGILSTPGCAVVGGFPRRPKESFLEESQVSPVPSWGRVDICGGIYWTGVRDVEGAVLQPVNAV